MVFVGCAAEDEPLQVEASSEDDAHDGDVVGDPPDGDTPEDGDDPAPAVDDEDAEGAGPEGGQGAGSGGCAEGELALACSTMVEFMDDAQLLMDDLFADDDCRLVTVRGIGVTSSGTVDPWMPGASWRVIHRCDGRDVVLDYAPDDSEASGFPMLQAYANEAALPQTWEGPWIDSDELISQLQDEGCVDAEAEPMEVTLNLTAEGPELALYVVHQHDAAFTLATNENGEQLGTLACD